MKRFAALVTLMMVLLSISPAFASDGTLIQWTDEQYIASPTTSTSTLSPNALYVIRPQVSLCKNKGTDKIEPLKFGMELKLLYWANDYCQVQSPSGQIGYVSTGFIAYCLRNLRWIDGDGVALSPRPKMTSSDFGYAAGGLRMNEKAVVLFEDGNWLYLVTETGYSGYVYRYNVNLHLY